MCAVTLPDSCFQQAPADSETSGEREAQQPRTRIGPFGLGDTLQIQCCMESCLAHLPSPFTQPAIHTTGGSTGLGAWCRGLANGAGALAAEALLRTGLNSAASVSMPSGLPEPLALFEQDSNLSRRTAGLQQGPTRRPRSGGTDSEAVPVQHNFNL